MLGALLGALALLTIVSAGRAFANTVSYAGSVTSGQTRVIVVFKLIGRGCPRGPHCFDHPKVTEFGSVNFSYPACPDLLEGAFEFGNPSTGQPAAVKVGRQHSFGGRGQDDYDATIRGSFHGQFLRHGAKAKGWVQVDNGGCLTGKLNWTATPQR